MIRKQLDNWPPFAHPKGHRICAYCGGCSSVVEHLVPLASGIQVHHPANFVPACNGCNVSKGSRRWQQWFRSRPFWTQEAEDMIWRYCGPFAWLNASGEASCGLASRGEVGSAKLGYVLQS